MGVRAAVRAVRLSRGLRTKVAVDVLLVLPSPVTAAVAANAFCVIYVIPLVTRVRGERASSSLLLFFSFSAGHNTGAGAACSLRGPPLRQFAAVNTFSFFDAGTLCGL